jgi:hypothetical protein
MIDFRLLCQELADALAEQDRCWMLINEARAALAQPEPVAPTDEELSSRFRAWWHNEGSGLPPLPGMDHEEHVRRISEIAWANGAYVARWGTPASNPVPVSERLPGPENKTTDDECWFWDPISGCWFLLPGSPLNDHYTHWLPHWALPVPAIAAELEAQ